MVCRDERVIDDAVTLCTAEHDGRRGRDEYPHFSPGYGQQIDIMCGLRGQSLSIDVPLAGATRKRCHALRTSSFCRNGVHAVGIVRSCNMNHVAKCGAEGWRRNRMAVSW